MAEFAQVLYSLLVIAAAIIIYFLPTLIARERKHPQLEALALVNFFFGITMIGWVVCLVWCSALTTHKKQEIGA